MNMKRFINRMILAVAVLFAGTGNAMADDNLTLVNELTTNATVNFFVSDDVPTATAPGTSATTVLHGKYLVVEVTPADDYWTYDELLTVQAVGSSGGALAPRRADMMLAAKPTALATNQANGKGYYYYQIPDECTAANGYTKVVFGGSVVPKFDLSTGVLSSTIASTSASTLTVTTTGGWEAVITIDQSSYPYNGELQNSAFTHNIVVKKDGTTAFEIPKTRHGKHIRYYIKSKTEPITWVSGVIDAGDYTAKISALEHSLFKSEKVGVPFEITPKELTASVTAQSKTYDGTTTATVTGTVDTGITSYYVETLTISGLKGTFDDANA